MQRFLTLGSLALLPLAFAPLAQDSDGFTQEELEALTEEIKGEIEELRGLAFKRPVEVAVTDREGFLAYAKKRIEKTSSMEEIAAQEAIAKLTGVLSPELDLLEETFKVLEEQVGGFYDPSADAFYLMESFGGDLARIILAHELTHALDDQHFDIDGTIEELEGNADALFAFHAVVEGSGTAVMNRWTIQRLAELDAAALAGGGGVSMDAISEAPPYLWKPLLGTYLCGASFLTRTDSIMKGQMTAPDTDDIDRAFTTPPRSSEQVLHPEKYWEEGAHDPPVGLGIDASGLPAGWEVLHEDTFGELGLGLVTEPLERRDGLDLENPMAILGMKFTNDPARGWEGDRHVLLGRGAARVLVSLSLWEDAKEAEEFQAGLAALEEHLRESSRGFAAVLEQEASAFLVRPGTLEHSILFVGAAGAGEDEVESLLAGLAFAVEPD